VSEQILKPGDRLSLSRQHHFRIDYPADPRSRTGHSTFWAGLGVVGALLALAGCWIWRLFT
jgi:hypothetical protein